MHANGNVVTIHGDDFIAGGSQQGLDSLNHSVENQLPRDIAGKNCSQKSGKFLRTVVFAGGAYCW